MSKSKRRTSRPVTLRSDGRGLMSAEQVASLFGYESGETIRKKEGPGGIEKLTVVDISRADSQRRTLRLVTSEVLALYDELVGNARERTSLDRMLKDREKRLLRSQKRNLRKPE